MREKVKKMCNGKCKDCTLKGNCPIEDFMGIKGMTPDMDFEIPMDAPDFPPELLEELLLEALRLSEEVIQMLGTAQSSKPKGEKSRQERLDELVADSVLYIGEKECFDRVADLLLQIKNGITTREAGNLYAGRWAYRMNLQNIPAIDVGIPASMLRRVIEDVNSRSEDTEYYMIQSKKGGYIIEVGIRLKKETRKKLRDEL